MKKLLLTFTLLFSTLMFSTPSYGEWTKVSESVKGDTTYMDFETIRHHGGYVYFWDLIDYVKSTESVYVSQKTYHQVDCNLFRFKYLSIINHKEPMGGGTGRPSNLDNNTWVYPPPGTVGAIKLKEVCNH